MIYHDTCISVPLILYVTVSSSDWKHYKNPTKIKLVFQLILKGKKAEMISVDNYLKLSLDIGSVKKQRKGSYKVIEINLNIIFEE